MGSIHYCAVPPEAELLDARHRRAALGRELSPGERRAIRDLSAALERRLREWMAGLNRSGAWRRHYSRAAHMWLEDVARADGEAVPPADGLYVHAGPEGLFCTGAEDEGWDDWSFFGFLNLDDLERDLDVEPFLREYVRRLSMLVPDLLWLFDHGPQAYWRGLAVTIKGRRSAGPRRTAPRRDRIPRHVMEALGDAPPLPPERCRLCGRADHGVTPQDLPGAVAPAHEECYKIYRRGVMGGLPPSKERKSSSMAPRTLEITDHEETSEDHGRHR